MRIACAFLACVFLPVSVTNAGPLYESCRSLDGIKPFFEEGKETKNWIELYRKNRAAGLGEPNIIFKSLEQAREFILKSPGINLKKEGIDFSDYTKLEQSFGTMDKSIFYGKPVGWMSRSPDGHQYMKYRIDYEPLDAAHPNARGLHYNVDGVVKNQNGTYEKVKLSVQIPTPCAPHCTNEQILKITKTLLDRPTKIRGDQLQLGSSGNPEEDEEVSEDQRWFQKMKEEAEENRKKR